MENNKIVYIHRKKTDNTIFYVGIGEPKRAYVKYNRSSLWNNTVNKHGYYVEVILEGLSQEDACDIEIYLINKFGRKDLSLGALVNLTEGGEGIVNASEETKRKISEAQKGNTAWLGRKHSEETKKRMSIAQKGHTNGLGRIHSKETKKKISDKQSKGVLDTLTGKIYKSVNEASEAVNVRPNTMSRWLSGCRKNNSTLRYLN